MLMKSCKKIAELWKRLENRKLTALREFFDTVAKKRALKRELPLFLCVELALTIMLTIMLPCLKFFHDTKIIANQYYAFLAALVLSYLISYPFIIWVLPLLSRKLKQLQSKQSQ